MCVFSGKEPTEFSEKEKKKKGLQMECRKFVLMYVIAPGKEAGYINMISLAWYAG